MHPRQDSNLELDFGPQPVDWSIGRLYRTSGGGQHSTDSNRQWQSSGTNKLKVAAVNEV